ncbi:putative C-mannosyltransferase DPY19L1 [Nymphon striatum]|nr:putative C-mannosyltransferase DPY19L1 [Nymphon striatum]
MLRPSSSSGSRMADNSTLTLPDTLLKKLASAEPNMERRILGHYSVSVDALLNVSDKNEFILPERCEQNGAPNNCLGVAAIGRLLGFEGTDCLDTLEYTPVGLVVEPWCKDALPSFCVLNGAAKDVRSETDDLKYTPEISDMAVVKRRHGSKKSSYNERKLSSQRAFEAPTNGFKSIFMNYVRPLAFLLIIVFCGFANTRHQSSIFENDRSFSHLSTLEREMTFRTEMGLYYSYFKVFTEVPSFVDGLYNLLNDNRTEFPSTINTLQRFNVYPEVIIGALYRIYMATTDYLEIQNKICYTVSRREGMSDIESCEGMGEPSIFYVNIVFLWNGLVSSLIFIFGYVLTNSLHGGVLSAACFFFNHGQCTRVQWAPPLRESFGYPIFLAQMLYVTRIISKKETVHSKAVIVILNTLYMLTWQFAQFSLLSQLFVLMIMLFLRIIQPVMVYTILHAHLLALCISYCLLFGNTMLITSFYSAFLISALVRLALSQFTDYQDFHTLLYTCAPEFDFLPLNTIYALCFTLVLPTTVVVCCVIAFRYVQSLINSKFQEFCKEYDAIVYNILQMCAFAAMAFLVMRLKMFLNPHLCVMASLIVCQNVFKFLKPKQHAALIILIISGMSIQGIGNINNQRKMIGEYNNPNLEEVMNWIESSTPTTAVFAGPMPTMANIMLSTRRAIVNHPHYEDAGLRARSEIVYSLFSRQSEHSVWRNLKEMKVTHCVIGRMWCFHLSARQPIKDCLGAFTCLKGQPKMVRAHGCFGCILVQVLTNSSSDHCAKSMLCPSQHIDKAPTIDINNIYKVFDDVIPPNSTHIEDISIRSKGGHLRRRLVGNAIPKKIWVSVDGLESCRQTRSQGP